MTTEISTVRIKPSHDKMVFIKLNDNRNERNKSNKEQAISLRCGKRKECSD